jgi:hypothetical protein
MPMRHPLARLTGALALSAATLLIAACNSSSSDGSNTTTQSATGIWSGTDSVSGDTVTAFINSGGQAVFIRSDGIQFKGAVQVSASTLAASVDGYPDFAQTFSDGSSYGIGTLSGTVMSGDTLTATLSFTTNGNTAITGTWSLTYESLSDTASSPSAFAGTFTDAASGATFTISTAGAITITNSPNGCSLTGSITTSDTAHNIYEVSYSYSACTGTYQPLNGVQFTGLGTINSTLSPVQAVIAATGTLNTNYYGIVTTLTSTS